MDAIHYRAPKAFRVHMERIDKALRRQELLDHPSIARPQAEALEHQAAHLEPMGEP